MTWPYYEKVQFWGIFGISGQILGISIWGPKTGQKSIWAKQKITLKIPLPILKNQKMGDFFLPTWPSRNTTIFCFGLRYVFAIFL